MLELRPGSKPTRIDLRYKARVLLCLTGSEASSSSAGWHVKKCCLLGTLSRGSMTSFIK